MNKPAKLSELYFQAIHLTRGSNAEKITLVIVAGEDTEGKPQVWTDEHSYYKTDHENSIIREALRTMGSRKIPFFNAPEAMRDEWLNPDGTWFTNDEKEIAVNK